MQRNWRGNNPHDGTRRRRLTREPSEELMEHALQPGDGLDRSLDIRREIRELRQEIDRLLAASRDYEALMAAYFLDVTVAQRERELRSLMGRDQALLA